MLKRLLITGAAGGLGRLARQRLKGLAATLRLSDIAPLEPAGAGEEVVPCDLGDRASVAALVEGCDGIVHLGGVSVEQPFAPILNANIAGVYNLYEAARRNGRPRIFLASSNHVAGFHRQDERLGADAPLAPDSLYGVSKCFAEHLAQLYYLKTGQETAIVRIGSCFAEPRDRRMLATWLSPDDFVALIGRVFTVKTLGCPVIYGVSANRDTWWDNSHAADLGWTPKDSSEAFRAKVEAAAPEPDPASPEAVYQGGKFAAVALPDEP